MLKFFKKMKKNRKGYTLTELIVVVAILGVLAVVATPMIMNTLKDSKQKADLSSAKSIETAVQLCLADGSLEMPDTGIKFGTKVTGSSATSLETAIIEKLVGHEYPETSETPGNRWFLNTKTGEVSNSTNNDTITNCVQLN